MIDTFGIPLAFMIMAALTLWVVIGCRGWWWLKMIVVAASIFFSISLWQNLADLQGWPTMAEVPQKFEIKWVEVEEPNKKTGDPGGVYVWLKDINPEAEIEETFYLRLHHKELEEEPRIHKMPYSRSAHEQAQGIKEKIAQGQRVFAQKGEQGMGTGGEGEGEGEGKGKGSGQPGEGKPGGREGGSGSMSQEQDWIFHELPPPLFPNKSGPVEP